MKEVAAELMAAGDYKEGSGWLTICRRLGCRACVTDSSCEETALNVNLSTLERICDSCHVERCATCADNGMQIWPAGIHSSECIMLINDFVFDILPSAEVSDAEELFEAMERLPDGACIHIIDDIWVAEGDAQWMVEHVGVYKLRIKGIDNATLYSRHCPLFFGCCLLENLNIVSGFDCFTYDEPRCLCIGCVDEGEQLPPHLYGQGFDASRCFSGLEVFGPCQVILKNCNVQSHNGTALMINEGRATAEKCTFSSGTNFLGIVIRVADGHPGRNRGPGTLSIRECTVTKNQWGAFLGNDVKDEVVANVLGTNSFKANVKEDITKMYEYPAGDVQPWRKL